MESLCGVFMLVYLVDDLGENGEYAGFLQTYRMELPQFDLHVFDNYHSLIHAVTKKMPDVILADMRFDTTPRDMLYGDIDGLAESDAFCGNKTRAEAHVRGMQGLLICRALRESKIAVPIILFASLPQNVAAHVSKTLAPITIIEGLIFNRVRESLEKIIA